jgi:hypothetical protein
MIMHGLKNSSFLFPGSRPTSPAPTTLPPSRPSSSSGLGRSHPLNKLSLSNFKRSSPAPTQPASNPPSPLTQDGSYLESLSLKLSEGVSKAVAPVLHGSPSELIDGKGPLPVGRGKNLSLLINRCVVIFLADLLCIHQHHAASSKLQRVTHIFIAPFFDACIARYLFLSTICRPTFCPCCHLHHSSLLQPLPSTPRTPMRPSCMP